MVSRFFIDQLSNTVHVGMMHGKTLGRVRSALHRSNQKRKEAGKGRWSAIIPTIRTRVEFCSCLFTCPQLVFRRLQYHLDFNQTGRVLCLFLKTYNVSEKCVFFCKRGMHMLLEA